MLSTLPLTGRPRARNRHPDTGRLNLRTRRWRRGVVGPDPGRAPAEVARVTRTVDPEGTACQRAARRTRSRRAEPGVLDDDLQGRVGTQHQGGWSRAWAATGTRSRASTSGQMTGHRRLKA